MKCRQERRNGQETVPPGAPMIATIETVGSSTRIEGVKLTDDQIERLMNNS
ncbi:MAG: hypothetical protein KJ970_19875 [Candidatus Eisenbacteria bacterium]|uniref:Uncharacterized protein n=1 Tax=Eiseniibacteriota bacterium TaxID=2212470 RepID=A0A948S075_UNCEI|nr:hypothetical protein [Candidatus Eisenbacteria bacterium]MBU1950321.1 hypothetical protein [Candidatus Eisenbacteria bacterium]MBU2693181.1 hypothetical protein [Candidatus Eisenbacteria bacterium]